MKFKWGSKKGSLQNAQAQENVKIVTKAKFKQSEFQTKGACIRVQKGEPFYLFCDQIKNLVGLHYFSLNHLADGSLDLSQAKKKVTAVKTGILKMKKCKNARWSFTA